MANLNAERTKLDGLNLTMVAADAGGDVAPSNGGVLVVQNDDGASTTVTVETPGKTRFGLDQPDVQITVPAGERRYIGPLSSGLHDSDAGGVSVTYSSVTSLQVGVLTL